MPKKTYRPSVGGLIFNARKEFLFVHLVGVRVDEWDFVKGGMEAGESEIETIRREITEELGGGFKYQILEPSNWLIRYEWPEEVQKRRGFAGTERKSFWIFAENDTILLQDTELDKYCWVSEDSMCELMRMSAFPEAEIEKCMVEWNQIQKKYEYLFT